MAETAFATNYQNRYCAFVDILGFRQLIEGLNSDVSQFDALRNLLARVQETNWGDLSEKSNSDFRAQSISDAVAISTVPTQRLAEIFLRCSLWLSIFLSKVISCEER